MHCATAGSNSAIFKWLNNNPTGKVLIIADGAAFGSEMDQMCIRDRNTFENNTTTDTQKKENKLQKGVNN